MGSGDAAPRIAVITCSVLEDEIAHLGGPMPHIVAVERLEQGLHNEPALLRVRLQEAVDRIERTTDAAAIVLGYGLCSRGIEGVTAARCRLIAARAHDCITLLLGSRDRYAEYVGANPGTYWYSPGWNRHHVPPGRDRYEQYYSQYAEKYGPDNAEYLMEAEQGWFSVYDRATYVHLTADGVPIGPVDSDKAFTRRCADWLGWEYDELVGDAALLRDLLAGDWDPERFCIVEPGRTFRMTTDGRVIEPSEPTPPAR